jgi:hypothetical protein
LGRSGDFFSFEGAKTTYSRLPFVIQFFAVVEARPFLLALLLREIADLCFFCCNMVAYPLTYYRAFIELSEQWLKHRPFGKK